MAKRTFSINVFGFGGDVVVTSKDQLKAAILSNVHRTTVVSSKKVNEAWKGQETCIFSRTRTGEWEVKVRITEITKQRKLESITSKMKAELAKKTKHFLKTGEMDMARVEQISKRAKKLGIKL